MFDLLFVYAAACLTGCAVAALLRSRMALEVIALASMVGVVLGGLTSLGFLPVANQVHDGIAGLVIGVTMVTGFTAAVGASATLGIIRLARAILRR